MRVLEARLLILGDARKMSEEGRGRISLLDWLVGDATVMPEGDGWIILFKRMFEAVVILLLLSPCSSLRFNKPVRKDMIVSFLNCSMGESCRELGKFGLEEAIIAELGKEVLLRLDEASIAR